MEGLAPAYRWLHRHIDLRIQVILSMSMQQKGRLGLQLLRSRLCGKFQLLRL
jgi:hypothetical protein